MLIRNIIGNDTIQITINSGSAIVYGSTTDDITNDAAIQFARIVTEAP